MRRGRTLVAQSTVCQQFEVGTRAWTDCVEDAATGGGLMPWIVVIPLGVMVIGMAIGFARQFSRAGRERARAHGAAGTAGSWLIFVSFIELAIGVGSYVGARRAGGSDGFSIAATALLGLGILLFVLGVFLKVKGRRRARIYHSGLPGHALIRDVRETGMMVNNQPMYEFDLDVEGAGFAPTTTTHREVVPLWMSARVGPQSRVPVKVDPSNPWRLIFDWEAVRAMAAAAAPAAAQYAPATPSGTPADAQGFSIPDMTQAIEAARQMSGAMGSGWHAGKAISAFLVLLVVAIVGGGLWFFASIFRTVSGTTIEVTDQVNEAIDEVEEVGGGRGRAGAGTTIEVERAASGREPLGYSVTLPVSWVDVTAGVEERQGSVLVDLVMEAQPPSEARIVVTRSLRYLEDPAPEGADIATVRRQIENELGDGVVRSRSIRLAGEQAVAYDLAPGADGLRSRQVAVMRGGQVLFVALTAPGREFDATLPVFQEVLASWRWSTVRAR
jgi:hypothetical protein